MYPRATLPAKFEGPPGTPALVINIVKNFDGDQSNEPKTIEARRQPLIETEKRRRSTNDNDA
jgi:hypothetical protein